jgi:hypothetical protein
MDQSASAGPLPQPVSPPPGLAPLPSLGAGVVGTTVKRSARPFVWARTALWTAGAVLGLFLGVASAGELLGLLVALLAVTACASLAAGDLALLLRGDRPVLVVDGESLHGLVPFSRVSVRLAAITRIRVLRRELMIEAPGGVSHRGRPARGRWVNLANVQTLEVDRRSLADYLLARADAARVPR